MIFSPGEAQTGQVTRMEKIVQVDLPKKAMPLEDTYECRKTSIAKKRLPQNCSRIVPSAP